jgi:hypothetical protein
MRIFTREIKIIVVSLGLLTLIVGCTITVAIKRYQQRLAALVQAGGETITPEQLVDFDRSLDTQEISALSSPDTELTAAEVDLSTVTLAYTADNLYSPWYEQYYFNPLEVTNDAVTGFADDNRALKLQQIIKEKTRELNCLNTPIYIEGNFANILSLSLFDCGYYLNLRLDTMEEIDFADLWLPGTDIEQLLIKVIRDYFVGEEARASANGSHQVWEQTFWTAMRLAPDAIPKGSFALNPTEIIWDYKSLRNITSHQDYDWYNGLEYSKITITLSDFREQAALYRKFITTESLFSQAPTNFAYVFYERATRGTTEAKTNLITIADNVYYYLNFYDLNYNQITSLEDVSRLSAAQKQKLAAQLEVLTQMIENKLTTLSKNQDQVNIVAATVVLTESSYDETGTKQQDDSIGIRISRLVNVTLPPELDQLKVLERLDWVVLQQEQNRYHFPREDLIVGDNGWRVFDTNGNDVTASYCVVRVPEGNRNGREHTHKGVVFYTGVESWLDMFRVDNDCNFDEIII